MNCLSVFDHFLGLMLKVLRISVGLRTKISKNIEAKERLVLKGSRISLGLRTKISKNIEAKEE